MKFSEFKRRNRYTQRDLSEMFNKSLRSIAYYLKDDEMLVVGKAGKRRLVKKPKEIVFAVEQPLELMQEDGSE